MGGHLCRTLVLGTRVSLGDLGHVILAFVAQLLEDLVKMGPAVLPALLLLGFLLVSACNGSTTAAAVPVPRRLALLEVDHLLGGCDERRG